MALRLMKVLVLEFIPLSQRSKRCDDEKLFCRWEELFHENFIKPNVINGNPFFETRFSCFVKISDGVVSGVI